MSNKKPIVDMSDLNREDFSSKEWMSIYRKRWLQTSSGKISRKKYRQSGKGKLCQKKYQKKYNGSDKGKIGLKKYRQSDKGKLCQEKYRKKYNESDKGKISRKIGLKKYRESDKGRINILVCRNNHRIKKLNSMVSWANEESIKLIYAEAVRRTKETGTQYDVDHIIPLQGKNVSGLHVEGNLRVMLHTDNCSKQNIFTPEMEQSVILEMAENE